MIGNNHTKDGKYFVMRILGKVPDTYNNPHVDYFDGHKGDIHLCTKEINVGDVVIHNNQLNDVQLGKEMIVTRITLRGDYVTNEGVFTKLEVFKSLGLLSKDAIWVTELMEFDEDEIQLWATCDIFDPHHPVMIQPHSWFKERDEWEEGRYENDPMQRCWHSEHWRIVNPTCKCFH